MNDEEARWRREAAGRPTVTGEGAVPPPVPPAPGGQGGVPGGQDPGYGGSPYAAPSPYGQPQPQQYGGGPYGSPTPQPYGYGAAAPVGYGWSAPPQQPAGKAVAAMVVGILGLVAVSTCWGSFVGIFISPVALGLGLSAKRAAERGEAGGRGQAVAGFVMGIIGTVLSVLFVAFLVVMLVAYNEEFGRYDTDPGGGTGLDARERAAVLVLDGSQEAAR